MLMSSSKKSSSNNKQLRSKNMCVDRNYPFKIAPVDIEKQKLECNIFTDFFRNLINGVTTENLLDIGKSGQGHHFKGELTWN